MRRERSVSLVVVFSCARTLRRAGQRAPTGEMLREDGWWIELFGGLRACRGDRRLERFTTRKCALLLAYLARYPDRPVSRTTLATMLWPDKDEASGRNNLSPAISLLRRQLDPRREGLFSCDRNSVRLRPGTVRTDVTTFLAAVEAARETDDLTRRVGHLHDAVRLYKGPFLPAFHLDWVLDEQRRLAYMHRRASHELVELLLRTGDADAAYEIAIRTARFDPLDETATDDVLRACLASGRVVEGWTHYSRYYDLLRERLGVQPGPSTEALAERIDMALGAMRSRAVSFPAGDERHSGANDRCARALRRFPAAARNGARTAA